MSNDTQLERNSIISDLRNILYKCNAKNQMDTIQEYVNKEFPLLKDFAYVTVETEPRYNDEGYDDRVCNVVFYNKENKPYNLSSLENEFQESYESLLADSSLFWDLDGSYFVNFSYNHQHKPIEDSIIEDLSALYIKYKVYFKSIL